MERAILVALDLNDLTAYKMDELKNLAESSEMEVVYEITQKVKEINPAFYVGSGKVKEIKTAVNCCEADIVIFNDELSPAQIRNLESALDTKVIDRSLLILDIFARRAFTKESQLEVELAQLKYMLPRLSGLSGSLSRQGGGFNAKGPGEKKIELDRRKIEKQIVQLKKELESVDREHDTQKQRRLDLNLPIVALVGYTNAGKSATMNTLVTKFMDDESKLVFEKDMLFATLSTSVRRVELDKSRVFLLIDTVGFVSDLPHHLVSSFKTTLNQILDASLLIHVVDASNPYFENQIKTTNEVIKSLKAEAIPMMYVFNKADLLTTQFFPEYPNSLLVSNKTGQNIDLLVNRIKEQVFNNHEIVMMFIPYEESESLAYLENKTEILGKEFQDQGVKVKVDLPNSLLSKYGKYILK